MNYFRNQILEMNNETLNQEVLTIVDNINNYSAEMEYHNQSKDATESELREQYENDIAENLQEHYFELSNDSSYYQHVYVEDTKTLELDNDAVELQLKSKEIELRAVQSFDQYVEQFKIGLDATSHAGDKLNAEMEKLKIALPVIQSVDSAIYSNALHVLSAL